VNPQDTARQDRATWHRGLAAVAAISFVLGGCGDDAADTSDSTPASSDNLGGAGEPGDLFPVTVTGANGEVTIEARPERIVVLSPSLTEMTFAVGAGDQVIAVDTYSDYPADAPTTDLSGFRPNVEAIGALGPDLVVVSRDADDLVATLNDVGIQALVLPSAADLDAVYAQIETIGVATGHPDEAHAVTAQMRSDIDEQLARLIDVSVPVNLFYEMSADYKTLTSDTFVGAILSEIGMENVADGVDPAAGGYPQLSAEYVLEADPEQLFVAHTDGSVPALDELAARPGWSTLQAVTGRNVIFLDPDIASRWGPRVVDLVTDIVDGLVDKS
jgi:iron complex transport system substrate-binding protein